MKLPLEQLDVYELRLELTDAPPDERLWTKRQLRAKELLREALKAERVNS